MTTCTTAFGACAPYGTKGTCPKHRRGKFRIPSGRFGGKAYGPYECLVLPIRTCNGRRWPYSGKNCSNFKRQPCQYEGECIRCGDVSTEMVCPQCVLRHQYERM